VQQPLPLDPLVVHSQVPVMQTATLHEPSLQSLSMMQVPFDVGTH
jgi:hypothetical protein